jgi:hypothetical protein
MLIGPPAAIRPPTVGAVTAGMRRIDPPRAVEVLLDGRWVAGAQAG